MSSKKASPEAVRKDDLDHTFDSGASASTTTNEDALVNKMSSVRLDERFTDSGRASTASNPTPNPAHTHINKGMEPVAKKDLPYMGQRFLARPSPRVSETNSCPTFQVEANFFRLIFPEDVKCYQYDVQFKNQKGLQMRKVQFTAKAFWYAYRITRDSGRNFFPHYKDLVFNGVNILWSTKKLNFSEGSINTYFRSDDNKEYVMTITFAHMIQLKHNPEKISDQMNLVTVLDEVLTARLTCLYEHIATHFHKSGRALFYNPQEQRLRKYVVPLGGGLEAWTGLHGAVKPNLEAGLLLNVDLCHSVFYKQKCNLVEFYCEIMSNKPYVGEDFQQHLRSLAKSGMDHLQRKKLDAALRGHSLEYRMPGGTRTKYFRYSSIAPKAASAHSFLNKVTGKMVGIAEYFRNQYNVSLRCPFLPCVCINKGKNLWVPMEFVYTDHNTYKFKGKIPERQLRTLVQKTAYLPSDRRKILIEMAAAESQGPNDTSVYLAEQDDYMKNYGVSVDRTLMKVQASLLPVPTLEFGDGVSHTDDEHVGIWDLKNGNTLKKVKDKNLTVVPAIVFLTPNSENSTNNPSIAPLGTLMEVLHHFGINCPGGRDAYVVEKFDCFREPWDKVVDWMKLFKAEVESRFPNAIPLCLFVFPYKCTMRRQKPDDRYDYFSEYAMIKYICDVITGVHCQGILQTTYSSMAGNPLTNSTAHNVAIKVLGKIGATLYTIEQNPNNDCFSKITDPKEPTLILGVDVTHPGEQDRKEGLYAANSVACVVGNVDIAAMQYEASVRAQCINEERTLSIKDEVLKRITTFEQKNGVKPAHIVVYRDGVSETQFQETLFEEKAAIKQAAEDIGFDYKPTLTYIVITKRHHTRFFPLCPRTTTGRAFNLKPGTLVESEITTKNYFDFYLISQHGPLGTSRPTHYYVLHDEWAPTPTFWQELTHTLTYSYVRCPKSISQPAPVMYAHLAAKRAKEYLMAHLNVHKGSLDKMTEYEVFINLRENMQKHRELNGMVFV